MKRGVVRTQVKRREKMEGVGKKWEKTRQGDKEKRFKERKETRNNAKERREERRRVVPNTVAFQSCCQ